MNCLYILLSKYNNEDIIKVGFSNNLEQRLDWLDKKLNHILLNCYDISHVDWKSLEEGLHKHFKEDCFIFDEYIECSREYYHLSLLPDIIEFINSNSDKFIDNVRTPTSKKTIVPYEFLSAIRWNSPLGKRYRLQSYTKVIYIVRRMQYNYSCLKKKRYTKSTDDLCKELNISINKAREAEELLSQMGLLSYNSDTRNYHLFGLDHLRGGLVYANNWNTYKH